MEFKEKLKFITKITYAFFANARIKSSGFVLFYFIFPLFSLT